LSARSNNAGGDRHTHGLSGLQVDHQLELGRLFDRDVGDLGTAEKFDDLLRHHFLRTRFIPEGLLGLLETTSWPAVAFGAPTRAVGAERTQERAGCDFRFLT